MTNDCNTLWLSITTYNDPKHTVCRQVYKHKMNAYRRRSLHDTKTGADYKPLKNEIWELDFIMAEMIFLGEDDMTPPTEEQLKDLSILRKILDMYEKDPPACTYCEAKVLINQYRELIEQNRYKQKTDVQNEESDDE